MVQVHRRGFLKNDHGQVNESTYVKQVWYCRHLCAETSTISESMEVLITQLAELTVKPADPVGQWRPTVIKIRDAYDGTFEVFLEEVYSHQ